MSNGRDGKRQPAARIADNWVSRGYLAVCAALLVWVALDATLVQHEDASFAAVWPWLVTAPTSLLFALLPSGDGAAGVLLYVVSVLVAAVVNSWAISAVLRRLRAPRTAGAA